MAGTADRDAEVSSGAGRAVIRPRRAHRTLLYAALAGALAVGASAWLWSQASPSGWNLPFYAALVAALLGWLWWHGRREEIVLDPRGIHARTRRGTTSYAWEDLLEVGWSTLAAHRFSAVGSGVVVRPRGGPFDVPGPNAPAMLVQMPSHGRDAHSEARAVLRSWCERHGVVFSDDGGRMLGNAPPGSPYRTES